MVPAYLNPSQSVEERVQDLLSRMTLQEKVHQMGNRCPAIPRLGHLARKNSLSDRQ
jgi:beta-glucosidase